jgi:drug/metabolite transporter (DMT)-like permease
VSDPLAATAGNFLLSVTFAAIAAGAAVAAGERFHLSASGVGFAVASGAVTSGLGYVLWYAALRGLSGLQAAVVQISVAPLAALGGIAFLGERITTRLLVCGAVVLGGIALAVLGRRPRV